MFAEKLGKAAYFGYSFFYCTTSNAINVNNNKVRQELFF